MSRKQLPQSLAAHPDIVIKIEGPRGMGKTTLAKIIAGRLKQEGHTVSYMGSNMEASRICQDVIDNQPPGAGSIYDPIHIRIIDQSQS